MGPRGPSGGWYNTYGGQWSWGESGRQTVGMEGATKHNLNFAYTVVFGVHLHLPCVLSTASDNEELH